MWEISNAVQLIGFFRSAALGVILCLAYDVLKSVRKVRHPGSLSVFFEDVCFSLFCGVAVFWFLLCVTGGEMRIFVFLGILTGFTVCRATLSRGMVFLFSKLFYACSKGFRAASRLFYAGFDRMEAFLHKNILKTVNSVKKLLKKGSALLYTKER